MTYDIERFRRLGAEYKRIRAREVAIRPEVHELIRAAHAAGMQQVDIVELTGIKRDQVRQICLPEDKKRSRAKPKKGSQSS